MSTLAFASPDLETFVEGLLEDRRETCGVVFTRVVAGAPRLIAAAMELAPDGAYAERTEISCTLGAAYVLDVANRARAQGLGLCLVHTHPHDSHRPHFSPIDDRGEQALASYLTSRVPGGPHLAMVVSPGGVTARELGTDNAVRVVEVGSRVLEALDGVGGADEERFDRQVRAFGKPGQTRLQGQKAAVVGVGGTGSVTCQQLAFLGIRRFLLIDPDHVETTNLNRVVGATEVDVGELKVEVARRHLLHLNPKADVEVLSGDVVDDDVARALLGCDLIFLCTDSNASRAVVGQIAYQYLIPVFDMGVSISVRNGAVAYITGRVQMLAPGLPCLTCVDALDSEQVRRELLTPEQRAADPYITGHHEPQPAVISLNSTVASLAVSMAIGAITEAPMTARFQHYDGVNGTVRNLARTPSPDCFVCSRAGALARGDSWPLPTRRTR